MECVQQRRSLILVVDDQADVLDELATLLTSANLACRCCTTAEEAMEAAEICPPDLIICDIHPDGQSGLDICERIREKSAPKAVPVMFLRRAQVPDVIRRRDPLGSTYYLRKPFDRDVLVELIDTALGSPHLVVGPADQP